MFPLGAVDGSAVTLGPAEEPGATEELGTTEELGAAPEFGAGQDFSGFDRPPHWFQNPLIWASSNVSSGRTRPHTIAWNGALIWSNRAMTGPHDSAGGKAW